VTLEENKAEDRLRITKLSPNRKRRLQAKFCRRQTNELWGKKRFVKPVLLPVQFGDGKQIIALRSLTTRRDHYVIAINSTPDLHKVGFTLHDDLSAIYAEIQTYFGDCTQEYVDPEDGKKPINPFKAWPAICLDSGCEWWQLQSTKRPWWQTQTKKPNPKPHASKSRQPA
jgi:hypothetical protein